MVGEAAGWLLLRQEVLAMSLGVGWAVVAVASQGLVGTVAREMVAVARAVGSWGWGALADGVGLPGAAAWHIGAARNKCRRC